MKITDVRVSPPIGPFEWTLVRVDTDEGPSGYGELPIFSRVHPDDLGQVRAALVGQRPYDIEPLLAPLQGAFEPARHLGLVHGTEIALLDLVGQALGVPIHVLLGGKYRDRVRMYADSHGGVDWTPDGIRANVDAVARSGRFLDVYTPVAARVPIVMRPTNENRHYLATKKDKLGHLLELPAEWIVPGGPGRGEGSS